MKNSLEYFLPFVYIAFLSVLAGVVAEYFNNKIWESVAKENKKPTDTHSVKLRVVNPMIQSSRLLESPKVTPLIPEKQPNLFYMGDRDIVTLPAGVYILTFEKE